MNPRGNGHAASTTSTDYKTSCDICSRDTFEESLLRCHRCITAQHTFCLETPIVALPTRPWLCPACRETSLYSTRTRRVSTRRAKNGSGSPIANGLVNNKGHNDDDGCGESNGPETTNESIVCNGPAATPQTVTACGASGDGGERASRRRRRGSEDAPKSAAADNAAGRNAPESSDGCPPPPSLAAASSASEAEQRDRADAGTTITIFCRRDFRRYMRWKRRELERQDNERIQEGQARSRRSFSSIIANATR